ncbi:hypothetical protein TcCL_ESM02642 [Trypanosoma cruzi]|nr:hypothetical protein TcCL_ESM02642 [Trypanosoma cruzi]
MAASFSTNPLAGHGSWASHLSPRMNAAGAIGRGQGMLTTKNLNFRHDYAQAAGDHQHLCALFNAQLAAQEKSDAGFPNAPEGPSARSAGLLGKGDATVDEGEAWRSQRRPSSPPNRGVATPWCPSVALSRGKLLASSFLRRRRGRWWWP